MSEFISGRISALQKQITEGEKFRVNTFRAFILIYIGLSIITYLLTSLSVSIPATSEFKIDSIKNVASGQLQRDKLQKQVNDRIEWLNSIPLGWILGKAYLGYSKSIVYSFYYEPAPEAENSFLSALSFNDTKASISQSFTGGLLRVGFVLIVFSPFWMISAALGYYVSRKFFMHKPTEDILGICDRKRSPFYSGIYGPFIPNNKHSGSNYSAPGLACPQMESVQKTKLHKLAQILQSYGATNETNLELLRVILAYPDLPALVDEENFNNNSDEASVDGLALENRPPVRAAILSNKEGTLESSALQGLAAVLQAHQALVRHYAAAENETEQYPKFVTEIEQLTASFSPLGKLLLFSMTRKRAIALAKTPATVVASAYLAIEAGKCLVFQRREGGYTQISLFPHLQARAVIQSILAFHKEYDGDIRQVVRQAIICSRRHGDFGRAFLPYDMSTEARALRDWLEILYTRPTKRVEIANLVELDAHIDELADKWRVEFPEYIRKIQRYQTMTPAEVLNKENILAKTGIVHKSVVLFPLSTVLNIAFEGIESSLLSRITELLNSTRNYQASITISARLPGFKRQAQEIQSGGDAGSIIDIIRNASNGSELAARWLILRRTLTRHNWLSTRIGDDAVPVDGLVQAIVTRPIDGGTKTVRARFDALVPLRQRRFREVFGSKWEHSLYHGQTESLTVGIYVSAEDFKKAVSEIKSTALTQAAGGSSR